jgi:hypothetical protein
MIPHKRGDVRFLLIAILVALAGLMAVVILPQARTAAGAVTAGFILLLVVKHLGLAALVGGPVSAFLRLRFPGLFRPKPDSE